MMLSMYIVHIKMLCFVVLEFLMCVLRKPKTRRIDAATKRATLREENINLLCAFKIDCLFYNSRVSVAKFESLRENAYALPPRGNCNDRGSPDLLKPLDSTPAAPPRHATTPNPLVRRQADG